MSKAKYPGVGRVYLLWAAGTQRFKIGFSKDVATRSAAIEASSPCPIRVVADMPGTVADEQSLHYRFRKHRSHREWFVLPEDAVWRALAVFGISRPMVESGLM